MTGFSSVAPSGCKIIDEAKELGALGSKICELRERLESLFEPALVLEVTGALVVTLRSLPVNTLEVGILRDLGGKLGGKGVDSKESLLECLSGCDSLSDDVGMIPRLDLFKG